MHTIKQSPKSVYELLGWSYDADQNCKLTRQSIIAKIPTHWRLDTSAPPAVSLPRNVLPLISLSGKLSDHELEITSVLDATALLQQIHSGRWTAEEVTVAFCKRAALAHQLVNCLMDIDFDGAIARAKQLDQHFKETGKPLGPLHGLPVSIKVNTYS